MGYNSIEVEDWEVATSGEEMSKLESLLLDKNRKMEHELTQLKVWNYRCVYWVCLFPLFNNYIYIDTDLDRPQPQE